VYYQYVTGSPRLQIVCLTIGPIS